MARDQIGPLISREAPLVSVIVPSYNKGPYLREAVESILVQEYPHTEIIIVNDESTDNTIEVAEALIRQYSDRSITLINKKNGGVSDTRNVGLTRAKGDFILPLDGDDKAHPKYLSTAIDGLTREGGNFFYCDVEIFGVHPGEWRPRTYEPQGIRYDNCFPTLTLFDRRFAEKTGGWKVAMGFVEDWEFWINCSRYGIRPVRSGEKLFLYRSHESGLASAHIHNGYPECLAMVVVHQEDLYPVEQVLQTHNMLLAMRPVSVAQAQRLHRIHPNEWFLSFWLALLEEQRGNYQGALDGYAAAVNSSGLENWQPIFRLGIILLLLGKQQEAMHLFHIVKNLRPDTSRFLTKFLKSNPPVLTEAGPPSQGLLYTLPEDELEVYRYSSPSAARTLP